jgi:hypothetical protein
MRLALEALMAEKYFERSIQESAVNLIKEALTDVMEKIKIRKTIGDKRLRQKVIGNLKSIQLLVMFPEEVLNRTKVEEVYKDLDIDGSESFVKMYLSLKKHNRKLINEGSSNRMKVLDKMMKEFHMKYFVEENALSTSNENLLLQTFHTIFLRRHTSNVHNVPVLLSKSFKVFQHGNTLFRSSSSTQQRHHRLREEGKFYLILQRS